MRPTLAPLGLALALLAASAGCKSIAERAREKAEERAIEQQTGGQVQIHGDKVTITGDGGSVAFGAGNAKVPDDFPKAVPVYPGAKASVSSKQSAPGGKSAWALVLETGDPADKVTAFYKSSLSAFKTENDMDMGGTHMLQLQSDAYQVALIIAPGGGKTGITLTVTSR